MKKNILITFILILVLALKGFALSSMYKNTLKEVEIKENNKNAYIVDLIFGANYTEPLSIQKKAADEYSVILPETRLNPNGLNIVYENGRQNINLEVAEHPYIDESIKNGYVKIVVRTKNSAKVDVSAEVGAVNVSENAKNSNIDTVNPPNTIAPVASVESNPQLPQPENIGSDEMVQPSQNVVSKTTATLFNNIPRSILPKNAFDFLLKGSLLFFIILVFFKIFTKMLKSAEKVNVSVKDLKREQVRRTPPQVKSTNPIPPVGKMISPVGVVNKTVKTVEVVQPPQKNQDSYKIEPKAEKYIEPTLLSTIKFTNTRGIYLIEYEDRYSLIGYINDSIFVLKQFFKISNTKLQARLYEKTKEKVTFIIRIDDYKALIEMSADNMKVVIEF